MEHQQGKIDLSGWTLNSTEGLHELIAGKVNEAVAEALQLVLDDEVTHAFMPAVWGTTDGAGGPPCADPLTVYVQLAAGEDVPIWRTSLTEMLASEIADCAKDGSFSDGLARIRDALRALADRIDGALAA